MTRRNHGKGYVGTTSKIRQRYVALLFLASNFDPKKRRDETFELLF
jgi:hypothetical protein